MSPFIIRWIVPPLIGALIGLFTNWIAIKMLFYPLREIRLLGVTIPFTPGILPRERFRISKSIGRTVAKELLTEEVLGRRLREPELVAGLATTINRFLKSFFSRPAATFMQSANTEVLSSTLSAPSLPHVLQHLTGHRAFTASLAAVFRHFLEKYSHLPLKAIISVADLDSIVDKTLVKLSGPEGMALARSILSGKTSPLDDCSSPPGPDQHYIDPYVSGECEEKPQSGTTPGKGFPLHCIAPLAEELAKQVYGTVLPVLSRWLDSPEMTRRLETEAAHIIRRSVDRMGSIPRLLLSVANYEKMIADAIPAVIVDLKSSLLNLLSEKDVRNLFALNAAKIFTTRDDSFSDQSNVKKIHIEALTEAWSESLVLFSANKPLVNEWLAGLVGAYGDMTISDLGSALYTDPERMIDRMVLSYSPEKRPDAEQKIHTLLTEVYLVFISSFATSLEDESLGDLLGIDEAYQEKLSGPMARKALDILIAETRTIVTGLDIAKIVEERINDLDIREVERIVLDVVSRELGWITGLGGILGALIGLFQSLIMQ